MTMLTMPSVEAQNSFGLLLDKAQRQIVSVTRRGRPSVFIMSPEILQDYMDGYLAKQAEQNGFANVEETELFLNTLRNV